MATYNVTTNNFSTYNSDLTFAKTANSGYTKWSNIDDEAISVTLQNPFSFGDEDFYNIYLSSNALLGFYTNSYTVDFTPSYDEAAPMNAIFYPWCDINTLSSERRFIYYKEDITNKRFTCIFDSRYYYISSSIVQTELILFLDGTGKFIINFGTITSASNRTSLLGFSFASSNTSNFGDSLDSEYIVPKSPLLDITNHQSSYSGKQIIVEIEPRIETTLSNFNIPIKTISDSPFFLSDPTTNSDGPFSYISSNTAVATISGTTVTIVGAGTSTITARQRGTTNYTSASIQTTLTVVEKVVTTLSNFNIPSKTFGNSPFLLSDPTTNSDGSFSYISSNTAVATISGRTVTIVGAGTSTITATQAETSNYTSGTISATLTVAKRNTTLTNFTIPSKTFGDSPFLLSAPTSNSGGSFSYISSNTAVATISGSTVTIVAPGSSTITATQAETSNYTSGTITATLIVAKIPTILTNFNVPNKTSNDSSFVLIDPSSNRSGAFTYTSSNPIIATISGNIVTILNAGTTTITATQVESANYTSASIESDLKVKLIISLTICFPAKTPVETDQGIVFIENIIPGTHTIKKKKIVCLTKTVTPEKYLVCIEKDALGKNIPSEMTHMSRNHKLCYKNNMVTAKSLVDKVENIYYSDYNGEPLYNIVLESYDTMTINNMIVETLHPENLAAKLFSGKYSDNEITEITLNINDCVKKRNWKKYEAIHKYICK